MTPTSLAAYKAYDNGPLLGWLVDRGIGLARTRVLAERIAAGASCPLYQDTDSRERDFGTWEGQTWNAIYRLSGNAMDGMIDAPGEFRPGGGETT